jgi:hypothetical protein
VTLRQLPGLACLGLLAALLAHEASYGGSHEAGGPYHATLMLTALAGAGGFALLAAALAVGGSRRLADGSVLAAALRPILPATPALLGASTVWFAFIELIEPQHAGIPAAVIAVALILATAVVSALARGIVGQIARIVFAFVTGSHSKRARFVQYWFAPPPSARAVAFAYRRFARPPPRS